VHRPVTVTARKVAVSPRNIIEMGPHYVHDELVSLVGATGVQVRRVRIVSEPVSDYIRFEHAGARPTIESGEDLRWLPRRLAYGLVVPVNDFWLLDGHRVVFNNFDGNGRPLGQVMTDDPAIAELCRESFDAAWKIAIPHDEFEF
jgi:hypothetical protein